MSPKYLRPEAEVGETRFEFCPSDANGFPRRLPPARKIGLGRRALTGLRPSSKLSDSTSARFESSLERDFFALLEFNQSVLSWDPQPVSIEVAGGQAYVPDVLVQFRDPETAGVTWYLYEVKYRDELRKHWERYKPRYRAATRFARQQGWRFRVVTEVEIRTPLLFNAKFLLSYARDRPVENDCARLLHTLGRMIETTPAKLLAQCASDRMIQARLLTSLWYLVGQGIVGADLTERLTMDMPIWRHE